MRCIKQRLLTWTRSVRAKVLKIGLIGLILLLGACAAYVEGAKMRNNAKAMDLTPPTGRFLQVDGTEVHVHVEGSGPDLILLHGAGGNLRDYTYSLIGKLKDEFRIIAFDRPGHGYTQRIASRAGLGETPQEQAALLSAAAEQLGVKDAVIVGHSFGGAVTMAWALNHPEQLSAVVSFAGVSNEWEGGLGPWYTRTTTFLGRNVLVPVMSAFASRQRLETSTKNIFAPDAVPPGYLDHVGPELSSSTTTLQATTQQVAFVKPQIIAMEARYGELTMPIELLFGSEDTTVPVKTHGAVLETQVPSARLTVLEGVGHMPHHANEPAAIAAIRRAADRAGLR